MEVRSSELALIRRIRTGAAAGHRRGPVRVGIGDDCAVLGVPRGHEVLVTTDLFLENRHFRRDWHTAESAGHRCLARGLSDLAAMGARPLGAFLSLALPAEYDPAWVDGFLHGFLRLATRLGVGLAGGDTAQAPGAEILADVVLTGSARRGRALLRSGARPGDRVFVTGRLGGAAAELKGMAAGRGGTDGPQSFPEPRLAVGQALLRRGLASAAIDLSDGLSTDLLHLCEESGVCAAVQEASIPLHALANGRMELALHGGEDYELLFTARPGVPVPKLLGGVAVTEIGRIERGSAGVLLDGKPLVRGGWEHLEAKHHLRGAEDGMLKAEAEDNAL